MRFFDRFMYWTPWTVTSCWKPRVFRGCDEWHNLSVAVVVPFLGAFILFYTKEFSRDGEWHIYGFDGDTFEGRKVEGCKECEILSTELGPN